MKKEKIREWNDLHGAEQEPFIEKARFLIDRGYIESQDEDKLAEKIYTKTVVDNQQKMN